jgi:hypothetical protein
MSPKSRLPRKSSPPRPLNASIFVANRYAGGRRAYPHARRQNALVGVRDRRSLPTVLKPEDRRVCRHRVEDQIVISVAPTADDAVRLILLETERAQPLLEHVECRPRRHLDHNIDILGWPRSRRGRVGDPQHNARATEEHDLAKHGLQRLRRTLEKLEAHAGAADLRRARSSSSARPRTRASPSRSPSVSASSSANAGSRREIPGAES